MRHEHPFDAATDRPACRVIGDLPNSDTGGIGYALTCLRPRDATLGI